MLLGRWRGRRSSLLTTDCASLTRPAHQKLSLGTLLWLQQPGLRLTQPTKFILTRAAVGGERGRRQDLPPTRLSLLAWGERTPLPAGLEERWTPLPGLIHLPQVPTTVDTKGGTPPTTGSGLSPDGPQACTEGAGCSDTTHAWPRFRGEGSSERSGLLAVEA